MCWMGDGLVDEGSLLEMGECGDEERKMGIFIFSGGLSRGAIVNNGDKGEWRQWRWRAAAKEWVKLRSGWDKEKETF